MGGPGAAGHRRVIRVLIADDQALLRGSFKVLLDLTPDISVVGEAGTGSEAVALVRAERPDVVLMDVRMPQMDGIDYPHKRKASLEQGPLREPPDGGAG